MDMLFAREITWRFSTTSTTATISVSLSTYYQTEPVPGRLRTSRHLIISTAKKDGRYPIFQLASPSIYHFASSKKTTYFEQN